MVADVVIVYGDMAAVAQTWAGQGNDRAGEISAGEEAKMAEFDPRTAPAGASGVVGDLDAHPGAFTGYVSPVVGYPAALNGGAV